MTKAFAYVFALMIFAGTYYALVLYPYALDADIKLWLTGAAGGAFTFVFGDQVASRTAKQGAMAAEQGAEQALAIPPAAPEPPIA